MKFKILFAVVAAVNLGACSTIVNGTNQSIQFTTGSVDGADCNLTGGSNHAVSKSFVSPAEVEVPRSSKSLTLNCNKAGYQSAERQVDSKIEATTGGNLLLGGVIGAGVDAATGAVYKYPEEVDLPMDEIEAGTSTEPVAK